MMNHLMRLSNEVAVAPKAIESAYRGSDGDVYIVLTSGQVWRINPDYFVGDTGADVLAAVLSFIDDALTRAATPAPQA